MKRITTILTFLMLVCMGARATYVTTLTDGGRYTIQFVSYDGNTKWGLTSSGTSVSISSGAPGSVFVAHSYTNEKGEARWIFVNNTDGYYLAYKSATQTFNISAPINEFSVNALSVGDYVSSGADCTDKLYIIADYRAANNSSQGCYILKEATSVFDNSSAPYYNGTFTSALFFTESDEAASSQATLAIAKFDALYAVKSYISTAANMSVLFSTSTSSLESNINAASTSEAATSIAETFLKSAEGKIFYAYNASSNYKLNIGDSYVTATNTNLTSAAAMKVVYAAAGKYYLQGVDNNRYVCTPPNTNSIATTDDISEAGTFYIGNLSNTTDNTLYFTTKVTGNNAIHFSTGYTYKVIGYSYSSDNTQWTVRGLTDDEYTALSTATEETLHYSVTDVNGQTYTGDYTGTIGTTAPTFTGCYNYSLSSPSWNIGTKTYSATINFPFDVTSNNKINYVHIYNNSSDFRWHVENSSATKVIMNKYQMPKYSERTQYEWAIYPTITNCAITFKIKNNCTGKYITSSSTNNSHENAVTLTTEGTSLTYIYESSYPRWCLPTTKGDGTKLFLSLNSTNDNQGIQELGSWHAHGGATSWIITATDFASLLTNLNTAKTAFSSYRSYIGEGLCEYSGATASSMANTYDGIEGADPTAAEMQSWTTILENPATKLTFNLPTAGMFLRLKGATSGKYVRYASSDGKYPMGEGTDAVSIFYYDGSHLLSFSDGRYWGVTGNNDWPWTSVGGTGSDINFEESNTIGKYLVKLSPLPSYSYVCLYDNTTACDRGAATNKSGISNVRYTWELEEVTSLPIPVNPVGDKYYATLYMPVPVSISNSTAYTLQLTADHEWQ